MCPKMNSESPPTTKKPLCVREPKKPATQREGSPQYGKGRPFLSLFPPGTEAAALRFPGIQPFPRGPRQRATISIYAANYVFASSYPGHCQEGPRSHSMFPIYHSIFILHLAVPSHPQVDPESPNRAQRKNSSFFLTFIFLAPLLQTGLRFSFEAGYPEEFPKDSWAEGAELARYPPRGEAPEPRSKRTACPQRRPRRQASDKRGQAAVP